MFIGDWGRWRGEGGLAGLAHRTVAGEEHVGTRDAPDKIKVRLPSLDRGHHQHGQYSSLLSSTIPRKRSYRLHPRCAVWSVCLVLASPWCAALTDPRPLNGRPHRNGHLRRQPRTSPELVRMPLSRLALSRQIIVHHQVTPSSGPSCSICDRYALLCRRLLPAAFSSVAMRAHAS